MVILRASYPNTNIFASTPPKTVEDLDVFEADQAILLDISAVENGEIGEVYGISSQTFSLPGTDTNNKFFGNLFDLGSTPNIAFQKSIDCQVLNDGAEVFSGKMYITDVITDQKGYTTYQINVVNETVDLRYKLENFLLREVDLSHLNHAYTYANISASWSDNLFSGDVVYPLVNYGIPEGDTILPDYALGAQDATSRTFDNSAYPLRIQQFRPAIRTKAVIDAIFNDLDYKYTSSFFDSDYFNNLYVLPTDNEGLGPTTDTTVSGSFWVFSGVTQSFAANTDYHVDYNLTQYDNYFRYDLPTDYYTAYANGYYNFSVQFDYTVYNYTLDDNPRFVVKLVESGSGNVLSAKTYVDPPYSSTLWVPFPNVYLTTNKKVFVEITYFSTGGNEIIYLAGAPGTNGINLCKFWGYGPAAAVGGGLINSALQFPIDSSTLDFMLGLVQKFNLVIEPVIGEKNVLRIEPYQDWINQGDEIDWTDKVDRSVRWKIVHPVIEQPKYVTFRDKDDEAANNKYTVNNFGDVFGTYEYKQLDSDLADGEREIGHYFAATPVKNIPGSNSVIIPTLGRRDDTGQVRPFKFKPRLLYKNGLQPIGDGAQGYDPNTGCYLWEVINESGLLSLSVTYNDCAGSPTSSVVPPSATVAFCASTEPTASGGVPNTISQVAICPTTSSLGTYPGTYWMQDEFGVNHRESEYVQMTTFEYLPTNYSGSISGSRDLHFGNLENPGWYQYFQPQQDGRTTRDAYHEYWATYINSLYDVDARKLTCNVFIEPYEIQNIALNTKYFIDGHYYRINKINGANLTYPDSVEVELIKVFPIQLKYPRRRVEPVGMEPIDLTVGGIGADGSVNYVNVVGGGAVSDYNYVGPAANADGFTVFDFNGTGSVSWQGPSVIEGPANKSVYGANNVDPNSTNLMVAGGNNTIGQQTSNVLVVGENNSIEAGSNNAAAFGRNHSATNTSKNVQFLGGTNNYVGGFTTDSTLVGGFELGISASSLVTMVGGASNDIINSPTSRNVTIGGLNNVSDNNQTTTIINNNGSTFTSGSGHTVIGDVATRDLNTHRNQSTLMGSIYMEGAYFYDIYNFTASAGGTLDLQSPTYNNAYAFFGVWNGASGDFNVYLPAISGSANNKNMEGRAMRFKVDGSVLSSSYRVRLNPASSDTGVTIDGASSFDMRGPYDAISLVAHNNNWFILQAKG